MPTAQSSHAHCILLLSNEHRILHENLAHLLLLKLPTAQGQPTGRLLEYNFVNTTTRVLASGLWYANGVALSKVGAGRVHAEAPSLCCACPWLSQQPCRTM